MNIVEKFDILPKTFPYGFEGIEGTPPIDLRIVVKTRRQSGSWRLG